ncbi:acyl-CoA thioesterase [Ruegeria lacuscaerulensis]|uniref:acyl-CoA thioesterase n=1 Tax=Ruegeria lacuscaerulensis TaxID=55218 RepID=UPI00147EA58F|nr:thioesterase family protein [Ruegeria lacuscaerulensis]
MPFEFHQKVLFKHCDPAGIVFFPRYFEMINDCVEAFFDQGLNAPFHDLHRVGAVPTAQIQTQFPAPSRHGDHLIFRLEIRKIGRSSADYTVTARCGDEMRLTASATLVHVGANGRPEAWPDDIRGKLETFRGEAL